MWLWLVVEENEDFEYKCGPNGHEIWVVDWFMGRILCVVVNVIYFYYIH